MKFGMKFTSHIDTKRPEKVLAALWKTIDFGAKKIKDEAKRRVPKKSGNLARSIEIKSIPGGKSIGPDTDKYPYAIYVEYGTGWWSPFGPHYIRSRGRFAGKPLMVFKIDGKWIFTTKTKGMKAQPYMRPALQKNRRLIADTGIKFVRQALK